MWFLDVDEVCRPVEDCTHPVEFVEPPDPVTCTPRWCGLCGTVGTLR